MQPEDAPKIYSLWNTLRRTFLKRTLVLLKGRHVSDYDFPPLRDSSCHTALLCVRCRRVQAVWCDQIHQGRRCAHQVGSVGIEGRIEANVIPCVQIPQGGRITFSLFGFLTSFQKPGASVLTFSRGRTGRHETVAVVATTRPVAL